MSSTTVVFGTTYSFDAQQAYINLYTTAINLEMLIMVASYLIGTVMIIKGIAQYKSLGQNLNQQMRPGDMTGPLIHIVIGLFLLYFPTLFDIMLYTIYGTTTLAEAQYTGTDTSVNWQRLYVLITRYCRLIGVISFFRGMMLLSKSGDSNGQPGVATKGMIHVLAGVMIYNVWGTVAAIQYTFGITKIS